MFLGPGGYSPPLDPPGDEESVPPGPLSLKRFRAGTQRIGALPGEVAGRDRGRQFPRGWRKGYGSRPGDGRSVSGHVR
jgi:hypothetical protein